MQIIFQDPFSSLDPRKTVSQTIAEPIIENKILKDKKAIEARVKELMETVGLAQRLVNTYPHELDGGRRQRIGIARALAMNPKFIVCDEPVSALDVSIQAQILNLLQDLKEQMGLTFIFITHDLSVVNHFADEIAVMYLGQLIEKAPTEELFDLSLIHIYRSAYDQRRNDSGYSSSFCHVLPGSRRRSGGCADKDGTGHSAWKLCSDYFWRSFKQFRKKTPGDDRKRCIGCLLYTSH